MLTPIQLEDLQRAQVLAAANAQAASLAWAVLAAFAAWLTLAAAVVLLRRARRNRAPVSALAVERRRGERSPQALAAAPGTPSGA